MGITSGSLSAKAKNGWAWKFGNPAMAWTEMEPKIIVELETQGIALNLRRLEQDKGRSLKVQAINEAIRAADETQITAIASTLGVKL